MAPNSSSSVPPLVVLKQPENLENVLAEDKKAARDLDCFSCRAMGAGAFIGLGAYSYWTGHQNLEQQRAKILKSGSRFGMQSRAMGINGMALSLVALGLYRFAN